MRDALFLTVLSAVSVLGQAQERLRPPFQPDSSELLPADLSQILAALCPGRGFTGAQAGCHVCPIGTSRARSNGDLTISFALRGHFVIPNSDDLLLGTEGCEDHAHGFGGSILFTRDNGRWRISREYSPGSIGLCRKVVNRVGRDGLVCYNEDQHYDSRRGWVSFTDLFEDPVVLGFWNDNMNSACDVQRRPLSFVQSEIVKVEFGQDERGGVKLTIDERCRKGDLSRQSVEACESGDVGLGGVEAPYSNYQVQYRFDGERFALLPASTAAKHSLDVCLDPDVERGH